MNDMFAQPEVLFNLAAFIMDLLLLFFLLSKPANVKQLKDFRLLGITITVSALMGILRYLVVFIPFNPMVHYLRVGVCSLALFLVEAIPFLYAIYLDSYVNAQGKIKKRLRIVHHILFYFFAAMMLLNLKFELVIGFDETFLIWEKGPLLCHLHYYFRCT